MEPGRLFSLCGILFKMFPFLLIFYYIFRKQYRVVISCFAPLALVTFVTGFMWGFHRYFQYMDWMHELNRKINGIRSVARIPLPSTSALNTCITFS